MVAGILPQITDHADDLVDVEEWMLEDAEVAFVTFGSPARPALRAAKDARAQGIRAAFPETPGAVAPPGKIIDRVGDRQDGSSSGDEHGEDFSEVERGRRRKAEVVSSRNWRRSYTPAEILKSMINAH